MTRTILALSLLSALGPSAQPLRAQQATDFSRVVPLKVTLVITEYDGEKKIASFPYTFYVDANDSSGDDRSKLRTGLRVPVSTAPNSIQYQYMDVGTNIDCQADSASADRYRLRLSVDRTYVYTANADTKPTGAGNTAGVNISSQNPIIYHSTSSFNLMVHDGQPIEAVSTTDPISGHVLKVQVTAATVK